MKSLFPSGSSPKKLSTKVFIRFFILIIAASVTFTFTFIRHQGEYLTSTLIKEGLSLAKLSSYNLRLGVFTENQDFLEDTVEGIMEQEGVLSCYVFTQDGRTLIKDGRAEEVSREDWEATELLTAAGTHYIEKADHLEFWAAVVTNPENFTEESLFYTTREPERMGRVIGYVRVDVSNESLRKSFRSILAKSILIAVAFLVIGSASAFFLSRRVTTPLNRLNDGVQNIGRGNLSIQVPVETNDEIGKLATTFNNMVRLLNERDIEKQKLMEQLSKSQRLEALGTLSGGIAHDFNNILTIIQSNLDLAQPKAPGYLNDYIAKSLTAVNRGAELVSQILNYSHQSPLVLDAVNIKLITRETFKLLERKTDSRIGVRVEIEPNLWKITGDAGQVQQVIMNLYSNAHDAVMECMENAGRADRKSGQYFEIKLSLKNVTVAENSRLKNPHAVPGEYVLLKVEDNGAGMDEQTRLHLFEPFFTTKQVGKGTGLGLSTVYGIVKRHSGWIDVRSEKGKGTVFEIYLPKSEGGMEKIIPTEERYESPGGSETVLVVDDEEHIMEAVREKLEELGYKTFFAKDGETALDILSDRTQKIDLVILDYVMPGISGIEVLQHIRHNNIGTKVLMYSGRDLSQYEEVLEGVTVIRKPSTLDVLGNKIRDLLGRKGEHPLKSHIKRVKLYYTEEKTMPYTEKVSDTAAVHKIFRHLADEPREHFIAVYLDSENKLIAYDSLSSGTTNKAVIYPKEVVRTALLTNAASVILIHNHPSGDLNPSNDDVIITAAISQACQVMDINIFDHLIISNKGYYSFSKKGLL